MARAERWYLHDLCLVDPTVPHNERFGVFLKGMPENTLRYGPGSFKQCQVVKNYLQRIWQAGAKRWEAKQPPLLIASEEPKA